MEEEIETGITAKFYFSFNNGFIGEELESFNKLLLKYFIQKYKINAINGRELYIGLIKDHLKIPEFLTEISEYEPKSIGAYQQNGLAVGLNNVNTGTDEEPILEAQGTAYTFDSTEYLSLMPDINTYNDGEITSTNRPTECKPISGFAGWETEEF